MRTLILQTSTLPCTVLLTSFLKSVYSFYNFFRKKLEKNNELLPCNVIHNKKEPKHTHLKQNNNNNNNLELMTSVKTLAKITQNSDTLNLQHLSPLQ